MSSGAIFQVITAAGVLMLLSVLFLLYRNPLFEIYLSSWGLC